MGDASIVLVTFTSQEVSPVPTLDWINLGAQISESNCRLPDFQRVIVGSQSSTHHMYVLHILHPLTCY